MDRSASSSPRVAVLTAISGEAVAIAFRGRADTRSFGTPTCGLSTSNHTDRLSDGGNLYLTASVMADRSFPMRSSMILPG